MSYAVYRLAFINEKELMVKLHNFLVENDCIHKISEPQNQVMYLHALAIHQQYSQDDLQSAWIPLLQMITVSTLSEYELNSNAYHRTLATTLELFKIDNPELLKQYQG